MTNPTGLRQLLKTGHYAPIPVAGKLPACTGWQTLCDVSDEVIEGWASKYPNSLNTGILTRLTPAIDIDITDEAAAEAIEALARERFEERGCFLVRIGKAPKRAILLRTDAPFKKLKASLIAPNGGPDQKIEILGDGQQLVAFGIHPDTKRPYTWHGGEPGTIAWVDLPYVAEAEAQQFLDEAVALLAAEHGYRAAGTAPGIANNHDSPETNGADWSSLIADIHAGRELHDSVRDLAAKLVASGMADGAIVNLLRAHLNSSAAPRSARWQERYDDIPRAIASARSKIGLTPDSTPQPAAIPALEEWNAGDDVELPPPRAWLLATQFCRTFLSGIFGAGSDGEVGATSGAVFVARHLPRAHRAARFQARPRLSHQPGGRQGRAQATHRGRVHSSQDQSKRA